MDRRRCWRAKTSAIFLRRSLITLRRCLSVVWLEGPTSGSARHDAGGYSPARNNRGRSPRGAPYQRSRSAINRSTMSGQRCAKGSRDFRLHLVAGGNAQCAHRAPTAGAPQAATQQASRGYEAQAHAANSASQSPLVRLVQLDGAHDLFRRLTDSVSSSDKVLLWISSAGEQRLN